MIEDKLTQSQRIRLEALTQANASLSPVRADGRLASEIISKAKKFEEYIRGEEK